MLFRIIDGGFGRHDCGEKIEIVWNNYKKSEQRLDAKFLKIVLKILEGKENVKFEFKTIHFYLLEI